MTLPSLTCFCASNCIRSPKSAKYLRLTRSNMLILMEPHTDSTYNEQEMALNKKKL